MLVLFLSTNLNLFGNALQPKYYSNKKKRLNLIDLDVFRIWSGKRDSNSRPQPWQGCALPAELFPQFRVRILQTFTHLASLLCIKF